MPRTCSRRRALAAVGTALVAGCSQPGTPPSDSSSGSDRPTETSTSTSTPVPEPDVSFDPDDDWRAPTDAPATNVETNVLVENLEIPWDVSVAANGDLFITERVGRVTRFSAGELDAVLSPADVIGAGSVPPGHDERPWWVDGGEGGTLGVAVHPNYPDVELLFVYYTAAVEDGPVNRISRFDLSADDPGAAETVVVDGIPASNIHDGGRLTFGPRGRLWATVGDAGEESLAADPSSLAGSILRVTVDGEPAPGNPDLGDPRVLTYGHRNPQGLAWLPDGTALATEHGPSGKDELNRLEGGANYGWPDVRTPEEYRNAADVHRPLFNTRNTTWAPTGCLFYTGDAVPSWRNRLLVGGLRSQQVVVATVTRPDGDPPPVGDGRRFDADWLDDAYTVTANPVLQDELGRVRHVEQGPDGALYAITSNRDGRANEPFPRERDDVLVRLEVTS
ncbi:PQQ-dependent sugar dehydrogenase [Halorarum halophilum]|uniref:PQQ-dependent sugar dehydrogenase n=1 Tax=Halorarum halophilum TaxID=2743090 RepID=A0A7D5KM66_9EURY|nr:PQQ-dependent sugar dehydrogenase [Halobaculum halophilum]QLG28055.1 PQQ-dependent sugar dehydrogenase [Halobaculum halophilum]